MIASVIQIVGMESRDENRDRELLFLRENCFDKDWNVIGYYHDDAEIYRSRFWDIGSEEILRARKVSGYT